MKKYLWKHYSCPEVLLKNGVYRERFWMVFDNFVQRAFCAEHITYLHMKQWYFQFHHFDHLNIVSIYLPELDNRCSASTPFFRTYQLWYHKFGNMVISRSENVHSLCSPGNQHYQKSIYFFYFFIKNGWNRRPNLNNQNYIIDYITIMIIELEPIKIQLSL